MKIGFVGDICLTENQEAHFDILSILKDFRNSNVLEILKKNDLNIGNLECPITKNTKSILKSGPLLKGSKKSIEILNISNINMVTIDNNHINDYGIKGIVDTIQNCSEIKVETIGPSRKGFLNEKVIDLLNSHKKIGLISTAENEFNSIDIENKTSISIEIMDITRSIIEMRKRVDYIIILSHSGNEYYKNPSPLLVKKFRYFADLGVDVIIGNHTHCIQGFEKYNHSHIFYSLGNFYFPFLKNRKNNSLGYFVVIDFHEKIHKIDYKIVPYNQCKNGFKVEKLSKPEHEEFNVYIKSISSGIKNEALVNEEWIKFIRQKENIYLKSLIPINKKIYSLLKKLNIISILYNRKYLVKLLNLIRCESHRENLIQILTNYIYR